jgi:hypothetical protein
VSRLNSNWVCSENMAGTRRDLFISRRVLQFRVSELSVLLRYSYLWNNTSTNIHQRLLLTCQCFIILLYQLYQLYKNTNSELMSKKCKYSSQFRKLYP